MIRRQLPKPNNLGASPTVLENLLRKSGADRETARALAVPMAKAMEDRGLAVVQTHVVERTLCFCVGVGYGHYPTEEPCRAKERVAQCEQYRLTEQPGSGLPVEDEHSIGRPQ